MMNTIKRYKLILAATILCCLLFGGVAYAAEPDMEIHNINYPTDLVSVGKDFGISFIVENMGDGDAHEIKVTVTNQDEVISPKSVSVVTFDRLKKGEPLPCNFYFNANEEAKNQTYMFEIKVEYKPRYGEDKIKSKTKYIGVNIVNQDLLVKEQLGGRAESLPKVIVSNYVTNSEIIEAGKPFDLTVNLKNTHGSRTVSNMGVIINGGETFVPVNSGNILYVDRLKPNEEVQKTITLRPIGEASTQIYSIIVTTDYEVLSVENKGDLVTGTSSSPISLFVTQPVKVKIDEVIFNSDFINVGGMMDISVDFHNLGREEIFNVVAEVVGEFEGGTSSYFVGNVEAGGSSYYDATVIPTTVGQQEAEIVLSYEDKAGNEHQVSKSFKIDVQEMEVFPEEGMEGEFPSEYANEAEIMAGRGIRGIVITAIVVIVAVGVIIAIIVVVRKRKKSKRKGR